MAASTKKLAKPGADDITVAMRMRGFVEHEFGQKPCLSISGQQINILHENLDKEVEDQYAGEGPFQFDVVMDSSDKSSKSFFDNRKCYELIGKPVVQDALHGYNVCLLCYGEVGSGKTSTMMGCAELGQGLLPRLLNDMCTEAASLRKDFKVSLTLQMLEVYNDCINDLFVDRTHWEDVDIKTRMLPTGVAVQGATEKLVRTFDECIKIVDEGTRQKTVAATPVSANSSRGHTIFKLKFEKSGKAENHVHTKKVTSEICFVDLAGHENVKTTAVKGQRLEELTHINSSLMYLKRAISELKTVSSTGKSHKDNLCGRFRNSKLTQLLANSLVTNSKAYAIITLSPAAMHFAETFRSLEFGIELKGTKKIKLMPPVESLRALDSGGDGKLQEEVKALKAQIQDLKIENAQLREEHARLKEENARLREENSRPMEEPREQLTEQPTEQPKGGCCKKRAKRSSQDDIKKLATE